MQFLDAQVPRPDWVVSSRGGGAAALGHLPTGAENSHSSTHYYRDWRYKWTLSKLFNVVRTDVYYCTWSFYKWKMKLTCHRASTVVTANSVTLSLTDADLHVQLRRLRQPQRSTQGEEDHRSHGCVFPGRKLSSSPSLSLSPLSLDCSWSAHCKYLAAVIICSSVFDQTPASVNICTSAPFLSFKMLMVP